MADGPGKRYTGLGERNSNHKQAPGSLFFFILVISAQLCKGALRRFPGQAPRWDGALTWAPGGFTPEHAVLGGLPEHEAVFAASLASAGRCQQQLLPICGSWKHLDTSVEAKSPQRDPVLSELRSLRSGTPTCPR